MKVYVVSYTVFDYDGEGMSYTDSVWEDEVDAQKCAAGIQRNRCAQIDEVEMRFKENNSD